jgi:RHS repeat-associated protein
MAGRSYKADNVLVKNTLYTSNLSTGVDGWQPSGTATLINVYGNVRAKTTVINSGLKRVFSTEPNKTYRIKFKLNQRGWPKMNVRDVAIAGNILNITEFMSPGDYSYVITATGYQTQVEFLEVDKAVSELQLCNFTFEEVDAESGYRFGFNGQEKDDEVSGAGNTIAYEERIYDSRLGRFNSVDPREKEYAWQSTYSYYANSPICIIDFKGGGGVYDPAAEGETDPGSTPSTSTESTPPPAQTPSTKTTIPIYTIYEAITPNIYANAKRAITANPQWSVLTYNGGGAARDANRKEACPRGTCSGGAVLNSCEEFPMASTKEGGAGAFTACVPLAEQWSQGGALGGMVVANKMKAGDQFAVVLVPSLKLPEPNTVPVPVTQPNPNPINSPPSIPIVPVLIPNPVRIPSPIRVPIIIVLPELFLPTNYAAPES